MAVKTNQYASRLTQDTSRGPSQGLWFDCPIEDFFQGFGGGIGTAGMMFQDDFVVAGNTTTKNAIGAFGQWASWFDTNAVTGTDPQQEGGVVLLSDGGNSGVNLSIGSTAGSFRLVSGATGNPLGQKLWFEARIAVGSITTAKRDVFVGLVDNTSNATGSGTAVIGSTNVLTTTNGLLGFHFRSTTNPTDVGVAYNVAGGTVQYPTNLQTLSTTVAGAALTPFASVSNGPATGFVKLGFLFDPSAGNPPINAPASVNGQTASTPYKPLLQFFVNGQVCATYLAPNNLQAATFPVGWLAPFMGYTSRSATAAGGLYIDWIRVAQLASF